MSDSEIPLRNNAVGRETRIWLTGNGDFASPPRAAGDCLCAVGQMMAGGRAEGRAQPDSSGQGRGREGPELAQDGDSGCPDSLEGAWSCAKGNCQLCILKGKYFGSQNSHSRAAPALLSQPATGPRLWGDPPSQYFDFLYKNI